VSSLTRGRGSRWPALRDSGKRDSRDRLEQRNLEIWVFLFPIFPRERNSEQNFEDSEAAARIASASYRASIRATLPRTQTRAVAGRPGRPATRTPGRATSDRGRRTTHRAMCCRRAP
jgi:hypothetical protein